MGRSVPRSSPKPRSGLCPELLADFRIPNLLGARRGSEGSFLCSLSSRFSGRGGGVGSPPRAWRRVGVPRRCVGAKKIVRLHRFFLHQISLESKLNGRQKVKGGNGSIHCINLYVDHCLSHCLNHCLDHHPEPRSGLCPELLADFRIPKPPGCSQGIFSSLILNSKKSPGSTQEVSESETSWVLPGDFFEFNIKLEKIPWEHPGGFGIRKSASNSGHSPLRGSG